MRIVVGSAFRNSRGRVPSYALQIEALRRHVGQNHTVRVIAAVGDCTDDTRIMLSTYLTTPVQFVPCDHGKRVFGSTEEVERLEALTIVGNAILDGVQETDDVLVYVESDLRWDPDTIGALIDMAVRRDQGFDVVAPLIFAGALFYDIFAFRKNGERFIPFQPYHIALHERGLTEVDSVGSCLVMRSEIARAVRMPPGGVLIGWCDVARMKGYRIGVAAEYRVSHPC